MSWNVNSVNARKDRLWNHLASESPDVLCLQEIKCEDGSFPLEECRARGYQGVTFGQKSYNGLALLSKQPLSGVLKGGGLGSILDEQGARLLVGVLEDFHIINVYVPNGREVGGEFFAKKIQWLEALTEFLETGGYHEKKTLLVGDFNIAPSDLDSCDPEGKREHLFHTAAERAFVVRLEQLGFVDTFRHLHPETVEFSWWDYRELSFPRNRGLRLDLIFASRPVLPAIRAAGILRNERKGDKPSDHVPVWVEL